MSGAVFGKIAGKMQLKLIKLKIDLIFNFSANFLDRAVHLW